MVEVPHPTVGTPGAASQTPPAAGPPSLGCRFKWVKPLVARATRRYDVTNARSTALGDGRMSDTGSTATTGNGQYAATLPSAIRRPARLPRCPRHVRSAEAKRLWRSTVTTFDLEDHQLVVLEQACTCVD